MRKNVSIRKVFLVILFLIFLEIIFDAIMFALIGGWSILLIPLQLGFNALLIIGAVMFFIGGGKKSRVIS